MQPRGERREQIDRPLLMRLDPMTEFHLEFVWVEARFRHRCEADTIQGAGFLERVDTSVDDVVEEIRLELMDRLRGRRSSHVCGAHGAAESGRDHRRPGRIPYGLLVVPQRAPPSGGELGHLEGAAEGVEVSTQPGDLLPDDRRREAEVVQLAQFYGTSPKIDDVDTDPFDDIGPFTVPARIVAHRFLNRAYPRRGL